MPARMSARLPPGRVSVVPAPYGPTTSLLPIYSTKRSPSRRARSRTAGSSTWELMAVMAVLMTSKRASGKRSRSMTSRYRPKA